MESLSDTVWDVVICGTGLQQSLLALSLSRSGKQILHIDPKEYYGGPDAAFSLQEAEAWQSEQSSTGTSSIFSSTSISQPSGGAGLSPSRSYSLALSPQIIHTSSALISQLVSSRAYRQIEFLAVGSFFIFKPSSPDSQAPPSLTRIPSTREDVFSTTAIPARAKRSLMKFLKFVLDYESETSKGIWQTQAAEPLSAFLVDHFQLDAELLAYVLALTLSLDGRIATQDGLATIHRHLTSMGVFGPGFAAIYPKWGGTSEIAQVACRAGAVGGGIYMLGTGIESVTDADELVEVRLTNGTPVKTKLLVSGGDERAAEETQQVSRLVGVVGSPLSSLFEVVVEGAPAPAVAVIAFPLGSVTADGAASEYPIYAFAHSSSTGECPNRQSVLYFTTLATPTSKALLQSALESLLSTFGSGDEAPKCLYQLEYQQSRGSTATKTDGKVLHLPAPSLGLAFDDSTLDSVRQAWKTVMGAEAEGPDMEYMVFSDREPADAYDVDDE
ncbi:GDP dissociation inhibitor-domain-containing protein [Coniochaeta sp. 2T2.1]|nr:GDP dissociation inhibitor-domain-containing protein [Coniochaeta sp. 2T2.1]